MEAQAKALDQLKEQLNSTNQDLQNQIILLIDDDRKQNPNDVKLAITRTKAISLVLGETPQRTCCCRLQR